MMNKTLQGIRGLVFRELALARKTNGHSFNSPHEGYGVIAEELDEASEAEYKAVRATSRLLYAIRMNRPGQVKGATYEVEKAAIQAAAELVQVAAMARKLRESYEGGDMDV